YSNWITTRGVQAFNRPLWIAWPNPSTPPNHGWPTITAQQYGTRQFSVGGVDADAFWGDQAALNKLAGLNTGGPPPPMPTTIMTTNPVHGKIMAGAVWYNWGDAVGGNLVPVQGFGPPPVGQDVTYWEAVQVSGRWLDRIGPAPGQGDWCLDDQFVNTLDVS